MKFVLDSNIIIAGFGTRGVCSDLCHASMVHDGFVTSDYILEECQEAFLSKFRMPPVQIDEVIGFVKESAIVVEPQHFDSIQISDENDIPVVATALSAQTAFLVTGDKALLCESVPGLNIVSPRDFWSVLLK